jgi:ferredoxin
MVNGHRNGRRGGSGKTCRFGKGVGRHHHSGRYGRRALVAARWPETRDRSTANLSPEPEELIVRGTWRRGARTEAEAILNKVRSVNMRIIKAEAIRDDFSAPKNVNPVKPLDVMRRTPPRTAVVDKSRCAGCGFCVAVCPEGAISIDEYVTIDSNRCNGCGSCVEGCPNEAILLSEPREAPAAAVVET